jgi:hypothetical protein
MENILGFPRFLFQISGIASTVGGIKDSLNPAMLALQQGFGSQAVRKDEEKQK